MPGEKAHITRERLRAAACVIWARVLGRSAKRDDAAIGRYVPVSDRDATARSRSRASAVGFCHSCFGQVASVGSHTAAWMSAGAAFQITPGAAAGPPARGGVHGGAAGRSVDHGEQLPCAGYTLERVLTAVGEDDA